MFYITFIKIGTYDTINTNLGGHDLEKKILAALELADHEVRLIVGQFYNGRLNILKVERVAHQGIQNFKIVNSNSVREAILKSIANASKNVGSQITSVLMLLPSMGMVMNQDLQTIPIDEYVTHEDLINIYQQFGAHSYGKEKVLVNVLINKFHINGISTRKTPLNEKCHTISVEASCYFCDTDVVFDYLKVVESTGLEIIDIILDDVGLAKEASLLEHSIEKPIITVNLERHSTKLTLFNKGQIVSNIFSDHSFKRVFEKMKHKYGFKEDFIERLIYFNLDINDSNPSTDPIFAWSTKSGDHTVSKKELVDYVGNHVVQLLQDVYEVSKPIFDYGEANFLLTGESSLVAGLAEVLKDLSGKEVNVYTPITFGVKDPAFSSLIGAFYYYKDIEVFRDITKSSINEKEFYAKMIYNAKEAQQISKSGTSNFTKKIKDLFVE